MAAAYAEVAQTKVSKMKLIALVAGRSRHCCWLLDFADYLTVVERDNYDPEQPGGTWLFPDLAGVKQSGTKLGTYISAKAGKVELPEKPVAGGIRPGACNTLLKYMPAEFAVYTTGHEMKGVMSSFFEYIDAELAKCMPGAIVLAGWPALPWGQFGDGPTPALLIVLVKEHAVSMADLEATQPDPTPRASAGHLDLGRNIGPISADAPTSGGRVRVFESQ